MVDNLKSKLPIGNPASTQGGPLTRGLQITSPALYPLGHAARNPVTSSSVCIPSWGFRILGKRSNLNRYLESGFHKHKFHDSGTVHNNEGISRVVFTRSEDIIGITMSKCPLLNYLIIGKLYLSDCRKKQVLPNIEGFKFKVRIKYQVLTPFS